MLCKYFLDTKKKTFARIDLVRIKYFWSKEFLTMSENNVIENKKILLHVFQYTFWFLSVLVLIAIKAEKIAYSEFSCKEKWPFYLKFIYKNTFFATATCGYYIGNSYESLYNYYILHNYFQMRILSGYI